MNKKFLLILMAMVLFFNISCSKENKNNGKVTVLCTTGIIGDTVKKIAGESINIITLMGPGVDPHLYKAKASDLDKMSRAKIIFYNGLHLEAKLADILHKFGKQGKTTVAVAETINKNKLIKVQDNAYDPHVWMVPNLWIKVANIIKKALISVNPKSKNIYIKNFKDYSSKLKKLHENIIKRMESVPEKNRVLITAHDAFNYFGKIYGLKVKSIQGISTASEASASKIRELSDFIVKNKIPAIFLESSVPKKTINALKKSVVDKGFRVKIGGELYSDALGPKKSNAGTYYGMIKHNVDIIINALK